MILQIPRPIVIYKLGPENTQRWGKDHPTAGLQFKKTGLDQEKNMLYFVWSEAVESKLVKPYSDTSQIVSVLWLGLRMFWA